MSETHSETAPQERRGTYTLIKVTELTALKAELASCRECRAKVDCLSRGAYPVEPIEATLTREVVLASILKSGNCGIGDIGPDGKWRAIACNDESLKGDRHCYFEECDCSKIADGIMSLGAVPVRDDGAERMAGLSFGAALDLAQEGLDRWREKPHNAKWWRRIDGTPIPNDLLVNIAEVIATAIQPKDTAK